MIVPGVSERDDVLVVGDAAGFDVEDIVRPAAADEDIWARAIAVAATTTIVATATTRGIIAVSIHPEMDNRNHEIQDLIDALSGVRVCKSFPVGGPCRICAVA
jgi:hypothetical protein